MDSQKYFFERGGCPFCQKPSSIILSEVNYQDTAEANQQLPNISGKLYHCIDCGIAYSSHGCQVDAFPEFYQKNLNDFKFLDSSFMQKMRIRYMREILRNYNKPLSLSRFIDVLSLFVFHMPLLTKQPKGLKILDVGCGFGEFLLIYKQLGNDAIGTEIVPELVERLKIRGFDCRGGELENITFPDVRFDVIILRAVFYRTRNPKQTLQLLKDLLAPGGEIAIVDPCPTKEGVEYFAIKHFPQGHFYICDRERYLKMLSDKFGLECVTSRLTYGRPKALLKPVRLLGSIIALFELLWGNFFKEKPYVLSYTLKILN